MSSRINRGRFIQIFVAILACFPPFFAGMHTGWTSPMATYFTSNTTKLITGPMTMKEISFMSSLVYVGSVPGALLSGWLVNKIGRKWSQIIWILPLMVANVLIILAQTPDLLLISRTLCGIFLGAALVIPAIVIAEIVEDDLKTTTATFGGVMNNLGIFFGKLITGLCGIYAVPVSCLVFIVFFIGCIMIWPDTPGYLLFRRRMNEAEKSLKFYRGLSSYQPLPETNSLEFEEMRKQVSIKSESTSISLKDFGEPTTILAIIVCFVLTSTLNFGGIRITTSFTETLVKDSGILIDLSLVDTSISSLQIIGCLISTYFARRIGIRRSLVICYCLGFLGLFGTGVHYSLHQSGHDLNPLTWSFVVFLAISIVVPSTGINNICYGVSPMLLPLKIRGSILGTLNVLQLLLATFAMHYYLYFSKTIGNSAIFTAFGIWCLFGAIFTFFFIPEVNNKSFSDIISSLNQILPRRFRKFSELNC